MILALTGMSNQLFWLKIFRGFADSPGRQEDSYVP